LVVFVLVLLSDVLGVEFPPHFLGIALKTLDEFPWKVIFFTLFFVREPSVKALGSHGGVGWELRRLH
jgi:hypothetical protein